MKEYASGVASSIKFFVEGEWVDAPDDAPFNVRSSRRCAGGTSKLAGCAGQRVAVAAYCREYFAGYLNPSGPRRGEGVRLRDRFGQAKWFIAPVSRSGPAQVPQR
jgi:hypothetical protein